jgi:hypothetical protein
MGTQRTIITISDDDKLWLGSYSRSRNISMAEAVRRGIARLKADEGRSTYERVLTQTAGMWTGMDGLEYQEALRNEWK